MPEQTVRACLITNPRSGRGGVDLSAVLPILRARGWGLTLREKLHGGHATEIAAEAARRGYDIVVGCGGDGTLSEIVDGLVGTDVAVGVIPGGTVNLWAGEIGVSTNLRRAAFQLVGAERRRIDVGRLTINRRRSQHFLLMAGLGFDGAVMARVSKPLKNRIGRLAVGLAGLEALPSFRPTSVRIELDGIAWQGRVAQIVVGNSRRYGGFTSLTPDALVDDGLLDVCLIPYEGVVNIGQQMASLVFRGRPGSAGTEPYRVASLTVTASQILPVQIDGGVVKLKKKKDAPTAAGMIYQFAVIAQGVTMLVPRTYKGTLFSHGARPEASARPIGARVHLDDAAEDHDPPGKRRMRITAVGADSFTAVRLRDGKVITVLLGPDTILSDPAGHEHSVHEALHLLAAGQTVNVKGKKDRDRGAIDARHISLVADPGQ